MLLLVARLGTNELAVTLTEVDDVLVSVGRLDSVVIWEVVVLEPLVGVTDEDDLEIVVPVLSKDVSVEVCLDVVDENVVDVEGSSVAVLVGVLSSGVLTDDCVGVDVTVLSSVVFSVVNVVVGLNVVVITLAPFFIVILLTANPVSFSATRDPVIRS